MLQGSIGLIISLQVKIRIKLHRGSRFQWWTSVNHSQCVEKLLGRCVSSGGPQLTTHSACLVKIHQPLYTHGVKPHICHMTDWRTSNGCCGSHPSEVVGSPMDALGSPTDVVCPKLEEATHPTVEYQKAVIKSCRLYKASEQNAFSAHSSGPQALPWKLNTHSLKNYSTIYIIY